MKGNLLEVRSFEKARISQKSKGLCAQAVTLTVTVRGNCNYCTRVLSRLFFFQKKTSNVVLQQQLQHKARSYTGTLQLQLQYQ